MKNPNDTTPEHADWTIDEDNEIAEPTAAAPYAEIVSASPPQVQPQEHPTEEPLPTTAPATIKEIQRVKTTVPKTKEEKEALKKKHAALLAHYHRLCNPPPAPTINADHFAQREQAFYSRKTEREQRIAKLLLVWESGEDTAVFEKPKDPIRQRLVENPEIKTRLGDCINVLRAYELRRLQNEDLAYPGNAVLRLKREIYQSRDTEKIAELQAQLVPLQSQTATDMAKKHRNDLIHGFNYSVKPSLDDLIETAVKLLESYKEEAIKTEAEFFRAQGLPAERTSASRRFGLMIDELKAMLPTEKNSHQHRISEAFIPTGGETRQLRWFGVRDIVQ